MSVIGNFLWIILGGIFGAVLWCIAGIILSITIIGIPFGMQCFKIAGLTLIPFGRRVDIGEFGAIGFLANILWILIFGWELCLYHLIAALIFTITIIGFPFAVQHIKLAKLSLIPFGARIY